MPTWFLAPIAGLKLPTLVYGPFCFEKTKAYFNVSQVILNNNGAKNSPPFYYEQKRHASRLNALNYCIKPPMACFL
jgi:hypothetical protein